VPFLVFISRALQAPALDSDVCTRINDVYYLYTFLYNWNR